MAWFGHRKLGIALTCADWRLHHPRVDLYKRMCRMLRVDGLDITAVPGPDGLLNRSAPRSGMRWSAG